MYYYGLIIGVAVFLIIGIFHPIVIKSEYYFSKKIWVVFLVVGLALAVTSAFIENTLLSACISIAGFSSLWSIKELFEQEKRVKKGWFPANPKRQLATSDYQTWQNESLKNVSVIDLGNSDILYTEKISAKVIIINIVRAGVCMAGLATFLLLYHLVPNIRSLVFMIVFGIHSFFFVLGIILNIIKIIFAKKYPFTILLTENELFVKALCQMWWHGSSITSM